MTATNIRSPQPGERLVWLRDGITFSTGSDSWKQGGGAVSRRGSVIVITKGMIDANRDKFGHSFLDALHDEEAQVERWGEPVMRHLGEDEEVPRALLQPIPGSIEAGQEFDRLHLALMSDRSLSEDERKRRLHTLRARLRPPSAQRSQYLRGESGDDRLDRPRTGREER